MGLNRQEIEGYLQYWNSIPGLFIIESFVLGIYYTTIKDIIKETFLSISPLIYNIILPFLIALIIFIFWAYKSHRFGLFKKKKITIGLFFTCDDFDKMVTIKKIIDKAISEIEDEFHDIRLKLYPLNFIKNKKQLENYIFKSNHLIDTAIFANISYGNCESENGTIEKIKIDRIVYSGKFDVKDKLKIFKERISISDDVSIRSLNMNWEYVDSNSLNDKNKIKHNFKDVILFYSGIYLIYMGHLSASLDVMKKLKQIEDSKNEPLNLLKRGRLNVILLELFSFNALKSYLDKKNKEEAYEILKDCEILFKGDHPYTFDHSITLARISYEFGKLDDAYYYTEKANKIRKNSSAIFCNRGFFALINNDVDEFVRNYKELAHTYRHESKLNFTEIVHFIQVHKAKYPENQILFDFAIAILNVLYVDKVSGWKNLVELLRLTDGDDKYSELNSFVKRLLTKGSYKSSYHMRDRKSKRTA
ncbi:hypothetical protein [Flavobacterium sp. TBRC 19031]|uniref:hypothetical protein n=1 Tax=Flavobacterium mekongense TaxID=3379707 RepID=UPI003999C72F